MTWKFVRVQSVEPREGFIVDVHFTDGTQREINLAPYLQGPIFEPIRNDPSLFRSMRVEEDPLPGRMVPILILMYFTMASPQHGLLRQKLLTARTNFDEQIFQVCTRMLIMPCSVSIGMM